MIITSIAGNNVGVVNTIGGTTAIAALVLLVATISASTSRPEVFDDAQAERLEQQIVKLTKPEQTRPKFANLYAKRLN